jgi:2,3-bisphosphoglycerate-dependent phosphoglycerate mutase
MAYIVLVRHGESEWNSKGLWTGWTDVDLSVTGREQARSAATILKDIKFDIAFTSALKRAQQTFEEIRKANSLGDIPTKIFKELNERDYGELTGKNKWEVKEKLGDEQFKKIRRSWDFPPPKGESLKMVYERVVPCYKTNILPQLEQGKNVIIVAHGNSNRALVKFLENIPDQEISELELKLGEPYVYQIDQTGKITSKEIRSIGSRVA